MNLTPAQILASLPLTEDSGFGDDVARLIESIDFEVVDGIIDLGAIIRPMLFVTAVAVHQLAAATGRTIEQTIWELHDTLAPDDVDEPPC